MAKPLHNRRGTSEPLRRADRLKLLDLLENQDVFTCVTVNSTGRIGMTSSCMKCIIGTKESPDLERKIVTNLKQGRSAPVPERVFCSPKVIRKVSPEPGPRPKVLALTKQPDQPQSKPEPEVQFFKPIPMPRVQSKPRRTLVFSDSHASGNGYARKAIPHRHLQSPEGPVPLTLDSKTGLNRQHFAPANYGRNHRDCLSKSNWSSCSSLESLELFPVIPTQAMDKQKRVVGTLQREMNTLFAQKMEEIRSKSPLFFTGKAMVQ